MSTLGLEQLDLITDIVAILVIAMPYLLLRLVDDFSDVPRLAKRVGEGGLILSAIAFFATVGTLPSPILIAVVLYFAGLSAYCAVAFVRAARRSAGVTGRRLFDTWYRLTGLFKAGLDIRPVVTHTFPMAEFARGFDLIKSGQCGKVVLLP